LISWFENFNILLEAIAIPTQTNPQPYQITEDPFTLAIEEGAAIDRPK
jgi:hypothetical protein